MSGRGIDFLENWVIVERGEKKTASVNELATWLNVILRMLDSDRVF